MQESVFELVTDKYVFFKGKPIFLIYGPGYGPVLIGRIKSAEAEKGAEFAYELLVNLNKSSSLPMRVMNDLDAAKSWLLKKNNQAKFERGVKFACDVCKENFYDLNREDQGCPGCGKHKKDCKKLGK